MVVKLGASSSEQSGRTIRRRWNEVGGRLKGFCARQALVHAGEIGVPRYMHRLGILPPVPIHFFDVVGIRAVREWIVGRRR